MPAEPSTVLPAVPRPTLAGRLRAWRGPRSFAYRLTDRLEKRRYRRALPFRLGPGRVITRRDGRLTVLQVDPAATGRSVAADSLALVVEACERAGAEYFLVPSANEIVSRVAVVDDDWNDVVTALETLGRDRPIGLGISATHRGAAATWTDLTLVPSAVAAVRTERTARVFVPVVATDGGRLLGRVYACRIERWTQERTGDDVRLLAPRPNGRTSFVDRSLTEAATTRRDGVDVRTLRLFDTRPLLEVDFPIDVVYLWVDGDDPAWRARKAATLEALGAPPSDADATADVRFRDGGELRYSMRSLASFAPWVRRVFLVTDGQVPSWLKLEEPRLTIVEHRELFGGEGALPTFNSHAIGARLHHIDGLAEHYLYLNDDVFFGHDVTPEMFFEANGMSKFFLSRSSLGFSGAHGSAHESARHNVAELVARDFGRGTPTNIFYHSPIPQRRSTMAELEQRYPDEFRTTWHNQFRDHSDIEPNSWLHHYAGYLLGRAVPAAISYRYIQLGSGRSRAQLRDLARLRDRAVFCINDHVDASESDRSYAADWLAAYFPLPGPFEQGAT